MRLFVAVDPPADAVAGLDRVLGARDERVRWVPPGQWHLTLVFCGEVDEPVAADLAGRLDRAARRTPPFALRLCSAGSFPRQSARARVLWVGIDGDTTALTRLAERCAAAARRAGVAVEDRAFRPHLTIGRARRDTVDAREPLARLAGYESEPWQVSSFRLVHSTIGAEVRHETLHSFALAAYQA